MRKEGFSPDEKKPHTLLLSNDGEYLTEPSLGLLVYLWSRFPWRGNIRELQGLVEGMLAFYEPGRTEPLSIKDIPEDIW
jgi:transcriptional regulator with PAS, ATPase and Fis domain